MASTVSPDTDTNPAAGHVVDERVTKKVALAALVGTALEWYDFFLFTTAAALVFNAQFFVSQDPFVAAMGSFATLAVGFVARPIGGFIFGALGDKVGRKKILMVTIVGIGIVTGLIGLLPNYMSIGIAAPILLVALRIVQGLAVGGEWSGAVIIAVENAPVEKRARYAALPQIGSPIGTILSSGGFFGMLFLVGQTNFDSWGWRIPFVIGALLSVVAFYLRRSLHETAEFEHETEPVKKRGSVMELFNHPKAVLTVVGLTLGGTVAFYTYTTYMQKFLVNTVHLSKDQSTLLTFLSLLIFACIQPLFGLLSDRIGRKPLLIGFGILGTICTVPLLTGLSHAGTLHEAFVFLLLPLLIVSGYTSINAVVKAELFPAEIRALGVGLPYAVTVALFGGTAEYIALWFKQAGHESWYYWYVTGCVLASLLVYLLMRDTKKTSLIENQTN